jgi:hypothetical protein
MLYLLGDNGQTPSVLFLVSPQFNSKCVQIVVVVSSIQSHLSCLFLSSSPPSYLPLFHGRAI